MWKKALLQQTCHKLIHIIDTIRLSNGPWNGDLKIWLFCFILNLAWKKWKKCSLCIPVFDSKQLLHLPNHSSSKIWLKWCVMYFFLLEYIYSVCYRNGFLGKVHFTSSQNNWRQIHGRYIKSYVEYVTYCFCNLECLWIASFSCNFFQCQFLEETQFHKHA